MFEWKRFRYRFYLSAVFPKDCIKTRAEEVSNVRDQHYKSFMDNENGINLKSDGFAIRVYVENV